MNPKCFLYAILSSGFDGYPNPRQPCGDSKHDKVNIANYGT